MMSAHEIDITNRPARFGSPRTLIRLSSILVVLLMIGHMSAYPWMSKDTTSPVQLGDLMRSVEFSFMGARSTYWNLYFGWGLLVALNLVATAFILWVLSDLADRAPRPIAIVTGVIAGMCLVGAYLSLRYFYLPAFLLYVLVGVLLLTATRQLTSPVRNRFSDGGD